MPFERVCPEGHRDPGLKDKLRAEMPGILNWALQGLARLHQQGGFTTFPRGPGFYFPWYKLLLVLGVYLAWVRTCWWVDRDARALRLPAQTWGPIVLGCGGVRQTPDPRLRPRRRPCRCVWPAP